MSLDDIKDKIFLTEWQKKKSSARGSLTNSMTQSQVS